MFVLDGKIKELGREVQAALKENFEQIDENAQVNQEKVLYAFHENRISESHLYPTTGYGYDDKGREGLDAVYAQIFGCEDALVRHFFISGTHALGVTLFGLLRPGDQLLSITGKPYDTLESIIGISGDGAGQGSLKEFGVAYDQVDMKDGEVDLGGIQEKLKPETKVVFLQRSKGYDSMRKTLSPEEIGMAARFVKSLRPDVIVMVDNCYGEFVDTTEPTQHGADIVVGSLIKNPGGGLAQSGAYVAGRKDLIERVAYRLTAPGIGKECGASLGQNRMMFQGLFLAPHVVAQSLKTAAFCAGVYEKLGFAVAPGPKEKRHDIIQAIQFGDPEKLVAFCQGIQKGAPIDSFVTPEPWDMPGYGDQVVMAAGAFVSGASIELSADGPIRPPYVAYMQGGLTFESGRTGILLSVQSLLDKGLIAL